MASKKGKFQKVNSLGKSFLLVFLFFLLVSFLFSGIKSPSAKKEIILSQVIEALRQGEVEKVIVQPKNVEIVLATGDILTTKIESNNSFSDTLKNFGFTPEEISALNIEVKEESGFSFWMGMLLPILLPLAFFIWIFYYIFRRANKGAAQVFSFSQSKIKLFGRDKDRVTFKDVAGLKEEKEEMKEVVDFLKSPKKFHDLGARIPRGVLLMGAPGSGKTLLARAVAGEANVPFFHMSGSEFVEMFVGVGASVTGDTPVLIKTSMGVKLLSIKDFVDRFYEEDEDGRVKPVTEVQTLGFKTLQTNFHGAKSKKKTFFGESQWVKVGGVFRHKAEEIYEIHYRGGVIKTTADHSIWIRERNMITVKKAKELKAGDILVNLPFKVRSSFLPGKGTLHKIRAHQFPKSIELELDLYGNRLQEEKGKYQFALENRCVMSQAAIGGRIGVSQTAVKDWQLGYKKPRFLRANVITYGTPPRIKVTPELMRLLGYYTAEGRTTKYFTQFIFGLHEKKLHYDCTQLIEKIFHMQSSIEEVKETNSLRITISSSIIAEFFKEQCGTGSWHKHLPAFIWELPKEYFLAFLDGYSKGDGYTTKESKLVVSSVSSQLIRELAWLCSLHGLQVGVGKTISPGGRIIKKGGKPLPQTLAWRLTIGKISHPFQKKVKFPYQWKKPKVTKMIRKTYDDYVYDFCGCENEAFFGGEKPILLHNSRVRDAFLTAKKSAPSILFIDEIDAIGRIRGTGIGGGHDEREQTLNQILVEMDGFERDTRVIIMAATNRPDILDPALLRPGRFDRRIVLDLPNIKDREDILKVHSQGKSLSSQVNLREIAERTPGFSGADLANLVNEAAILAARRGKSQITQMELLNSIEKVILGPEKRSRILTEKEKEITAYHESGHALVSALFPGTAQVRKISVIARGRAGGYTMRMPQEEKYMKTHSEFLDELCVLLGGYVAEEIQFKDISTGAANDLQEASDIARSLVTKYGMSKKIGPISFGKNDDLIFLGRDITTDKNYSEETAAKIDKEVADILKNAYQRTKRMLKKNKNKLDHLAKVLEKKETLEKEEFEKLIKG